MRRILAGIETEYGLLVEGRGAEDQIDDAMALVRSYPGERLSTWDYRYESPRSDLRGFKLERLAVDPVDQQFDEGRTHGRPDDVRSDQILPNGARFYNDHGHPEYATPECFGLEQLAMHDRFGQSVVLTAAREMATETGREIKSFKNNTDFHGASYGTHESYLVPRELGFEQLYNAVAPLLIVRQILTGAGKVGAESGAWCDYQLSQRADFFTEAANAETLYRRPVFNTRDECHADPAKWIRLHVIAGDANMMPSCTARKAGLVKIAIRLVESGLAPTWNFRDPVQAFQSLSRDPTHAFRIELQGRNWTTAYEVLESYFSAAEQIEIEPEETAVIQESRALLQNLRSGNWQACRGSIDWAAKRHLLESFIAEEDLTWKHDSIRSLDLEYHNLDPDDGLFYALEQMGEVDFTLDEHLVSNCAEGNDEGTRALPRSIALSKFKEWVHTACWRSITFRVGERLIEVELDPDRQYSSELNGAADVESFIQMLRGKP